MPTKSYQRAALALYREHQRWHEKLAVAEAALPTSSDNIVGKEHVVELRQIRDRLREIRHSQDSATLAARAALMEPSASSAVQER